MPPRRVVPPLPLGKLGIGGSADADVESQPLARPKSKSKPKATAKPAASASSAAPPLPITASDTVDASGEDEWAQANRAVASGGGNAHTAPAAASAAAQQAAPRTPEPAGEHSPMPGTLGYAAEAALPAPRANRGLDASPSR